MIGPSRQTSSNFSSNTGCLVPRNDRCKSPQRRSPGSLEVIVSTLGSTQFPSEEKDENVATTRESYRAGLMRSRPAVSGAAAPRIEVGWVLLLALVLIGGCQGPNLAAPADPVEVPVAIPAANEWSDCGPIFDAGAEGEW